MRRIIIDDKERNLSEEEQSLILSLSKYFYRKRYEYVIEHFYDGTTIIYTDKEKHQINYKPESRAWIRLHNHPGGLAYPSLTDRYYNSYYEVDISGVYGWNDRLNRLEVYVY